MWNRLLLIFALFCASFSGCEYFNPLGPIVQIGIYWMEGEAHKYYATDQQTILKSLKAALQEVDLTVTNEEVKNNTIYITAGDKARFHIKVTAVRPKTTKLSIRVNTFGDKPYAEMIYRHVDGQPGVIQFTKDNLDQ